MEPSNLVAQESLFAEAILTAAIVTGGEAHTLRTLVEQTLDISRVRDVEMRFFGDVEHLLVAGNIISVSKCWNGDHLETQGNPGKDDSVQNLRQLDPTNEFRPGKYK